MSFWNSDKGRYLAGCIGLVVVGFLYHFISVWKTRGTSGPDRCPSDGRVAEWMTRRADGLCDYGHSTTYVASHTWRGICPDGMRPLGADDKEVVRPPAVDDKTIMRPR